jgi:hypothetical protein
MPQSLQPGARPAEREVRDVRCSEHEQHERRAARDTGAGWSADRGHGSATSAPDVLSSGDPAGAARLRGGLALCAVAEAPEPGTPLRRCGSTMHAERPAAASEEAHQTWGAEGVTESVCARDAAAEQASRAEHARGRGGNPRRERERERGVRRKEGSRAAEAGHGRCALEEQQQRERDGAVLRGGGSGGEQRAEEKRQGGSTRLARAPAAALPQRSGRERRGGRTTAARAPR